MLFSIAGNGGSVLVHPQNRHIDHLHSGSLGSCQRLHDPVPNACPSPANKAVVAGVRSLPADHAMAHLSAGPEDAVEDTPVVHTPHALFGTIGLITTQSWPLDPEAKPGDFIVTDDDADLGGRFGGFDEAFGKMLFRDPRTLGAMRNGRPRGPGRHRVARDTGSDAVSRGGMRLTARLCGVVSQWNQRYRG